jgi:hypothetical protein
MNNLTRNRKLRLNKIKKAQEDLESALLTLQEQYKCKWATDCFYSLYYIVRRAKEAQLRDYK